MRSHSDPADYEPERTESSDYEYERARDSEMERRSHVKDHGGSPRSWCAWCDEEAQALVRERTDVMRPPCADCGSALGHLHSCPIWDR